MTPSARFVRPALVAAAVALLAACTGGAPAVHGNVAGSVADGVQVEGPTVPPLTSCGSPVVRP